MVLARVFHLIRNKVATLILLAGNAHGSGRVVA